LAARPAKAAVARATELIPRKLLREGWSIIVFSSEGSLIISTPCLADISIDDQSMVLAGLNPYHARPMPKT
jgi:hypothetical protein